MSEVTISPAPEAHAPPGGLRVVQINDAFDQALTDPVALLDGYSTLTGWSEALVAAGAGKVTVVQRFGRHASLTRSGIEYIFCAETRDLHRMAVRALPDIVHVNGLVFSGRAWRLRRLLPARTAIVVQDHASRAPDAGGASLWRLLQRTARRRAMRTADGFLFSAAEQADAWRRAGLIGAAQRIYEVMEASTTLRAMPRAAARQSSGVDGSPAVLWVGRLNANKDPLTILDGFERGLAQVPDAVLTMIYSTADLLPAVRERVRASAALQRHVRLVGRVPHTLMPAFYGAADLFVLGSHHEGSGYALLEALACGVAPVVTNIPTFRVMTAGGSLGALWTPGDAHGFARALAEVAGRDAAGWRARIADHFERALSWSAVGSSAMRVYQDAVTRRRASAGGRFVR